MGQLELRGSAPVTSGEIARAVDAARIALTLTEPSGTAARWRIRLDAELSDGSMGTVGTLTTRTPATSGGVAARVIGCASCPGAVAWHAVVEQVDTAGAAARAVLGAAVAPGSVDRAEVIPNRPHALALDYQTRTGLTGAEIIEAGRRIVAISATVVATAPVAGTIAIPGSETITVPPGNQVTVEPDEDLIGPITVTFANTTAYVIETVA